MVLRETRMPMTGARSKSMPTDGFTASWDNDLLPRWPNAADTLHVHRNSDRRTEPASATAQNEASCIVRQGYVPALRSGEVLSGYIIPGYFHEHSTPERYLQGNLNALWAKPSCPSPPGPLVGVSPRAQIAASACQFHRSAPARAQWSGILPSWDRTFGAGRWRVVDSGVTIKASSFTGSHVKRNAHSAIVTSQATYPLVLPDDDS